MNHKVIGGFVLDKLSWIQGRKIAICEPDKTRAQQIIAILTSFGLEAVVFPTLEAVYAEIERRHYTTHRIYLAILIDFNFAKTVEAEWTSVTSENPGILETPIGLMFEPKVIAEAQAMREKGQVRFMLEQPVSEAALHRLLKLLNSWKGKQHPLANKAEAAAKLSR